MKESEILVGNDITDLEAMKWSLRSPFEVNVVTQFDTQVNYSLTNVSIAVKKALILGSRI